MINIYKNRDKILRNSTTTLLLVCTFFVLSHILFLLHYGFFTNNCLENYHYLLIVNMFVALVSALVSTDKSIKIVCVVILVCTFIFLIIYSVFFIWLTGLAKAFTHG
jgi:hypothetical protein